MDKDFLIGIAQMAFLVSLCFGFSWAATELMDKRLKALARWLAIRRLKRFLNSFQNQNTPANRGYNPTNYKYDLKEKVLAFLCPPESLKSFIHKLYVIKERYGNCGDSTLKNTLTMVIQKIQRIFKHCAKSIGGTNKGVNDEK